MGIACNAQRCLPQYLHNIQLPSLQMSTIPQKVGIHLVQVSTGQLFPNASASLLYRKLCAPPICGPSPNYILCIMHHFDFD